MLNSLKGIKPTFTRTVVWGGTGFTVGAYQFKNGQVLNRQIPATRIGGIETSNILIHEEGLYPHLKAGGAAMEGDEEVLTLPSLAGVVSTLTELERNLGDMIMSTLRRRPLSRNEVEGALEALNSSPASMSKIVPHYAVLSEFQREHLFQNVMDLLSDAALVESVAEKIENKSKESPAYIVSHPSIANLENDTWEALAERHRCILCQDVKAAPHLTDCECSLDFCFECFEELKNSVTVEDSSMVIAPHCPQCDCPINSVNFNRSTDDIIAEEVAKIPDCESKKEWVRRRQVYFTKRSQQQEEKKKELANESETFFTPTTIIAIAVAVVCLAFVARGKSEK